MSALRASGLLENVFPRPDGRGYLMPRLRRSNHVAATFERELLSICSRGWHWLAGSL